MPWDKGDARSHTKKASSSRAQKVWRDVANKALASGKGDASAIRIANAVIKKMHGKKKS